MSNVINEKLNKINRSISNIKATYALSGNASIEGLQGVAAPKKGFIPIEYNNDGYPSKLKIKDVGSAIRQKIFSGALFNQAEELIFEGNKITSIGQSAFSGCAKLKEIKFLDGIELSSINSNTFSGCSLLDPSWALNKHTTSIGSGAFSSTAIKKAYIPNVTSLGSSAFNNCLQLEEVELSDNLTTISSSAFYKCKKLVNIKIPSALTKIESSAFSVAGVKKFSIPDGVTKIPQRTFQSNPNLIQFSCNAYDIAGTGSGNGAISYCPKLIAVWFGDKFSQTGKYESVYGCSQLTDCNNLKKIFINRPRAEVEQISGYKYKWQHYGSPCGEIVCNDDPGFMSREEFDSFDWENYTG